MTPHVSRGRTAYDEIDTPAEMRADAVATGRALKLDMSSPEWADHPREVRKPEIAVDEAAARIANALHLHLD